MTSTKVSTRDLCTSAGITYRQADHWTRCGYLLLDGRPAGSGRPRFHPASEIAVASGLAQVLRAGCRVPGEVSHTLRAHADETGNLLLDEHGFATDDLDAARWVVQLGVREPVPA